MSQESEAWQHGAFTKALLDGFNDPAADIDLNGLISATGLANYIAKRVPTQTSGRQNPGMEVRFDHPVRQRVLAEHGLPAVTEHGARLASAGRVLPEQRFEVLAAMQHAGNAKWLRRRAIDNQIGVNLPEFHRLNGQVRPNVADAR